MEKKVLVVEDEPVMTREKMLEVQGEPSRPRQFYVLNRDALVEECAKALAYPGRDPETTWLGGFMAPMTKGERLRARERAKELRAVAKAKVEANRKRTAAQSQLNYGEKKE